MVKIVLSMMLIGSCNLVIYTYTNAHGHDDMNTLFLINANVTPSTGKSFRISSYVRAANKAEAGNRVSVSLSDMGSVKIGKVVEVDTDGLWVGA